jgi:uncharacterized membrane protein
MKLTKENIFKRLRNWKTWVALFALIGMIAQSLGYADFKGQLGQIQEVIYTVGVLLGLWTDHETVQGEDT